MAVKWRRLTAGVHGPRWVIGNLRAAPEHARVVTDAGIVSVGRARLEAMLASHDHPPLPDRAWAVLEETP